MKQLEAVTRIATLLGRFVNEVKALNSINQYGINYLSETVLVPLFKELYGFQSLRNLNAEIDDIAGIDLADDQAKVAFQITATADNEKIKSTLRKFIESEHYKKYETLYIYILTEKHRSYSDKEYVAITKGLVVFDKNKHIIDFRDVLQKVNSIQELERVFQIQELLEKQFTDAKFNTYKENWASTQTEELVTNLLEITFPDTLYIADLNLDQKQIIKDNRLSYKATMREVIFAYKKQEKLRFSSDWIDHSNQIVTFHDLSNTRHDLSQIIDLGTVTSISPQEFYSEIPAQLRIFKALLKYNLSKQAFFQNINFYHSENMYVFIPEDEEVLNRTESWNTGKRNISRDVVRIKNLKYKQNTVWYYTHLAFSVLFKFYSEKWFLEITPEWFISKDGFQKHYTQHEEVSSFLKKNERNQHVLNHTKFIANYLKYGKSQTSLFETSDVKPKNFIQFAKLLTIKNAPNIFEDDWKKNESEDALQMMRDKDGILEFDI